MGGRRRARQTGGLAVAQRPCGAGGLSRQQHAQSVHRLRHHIAEGLEHAAGFLRSQLARSLSLRRTPELFFRHDPSIELGSDTLSLLRELDHDEKA